MEAELESTVRANGCQRIHFARNVGFSVESECTHSARRGCFQVIHSSYFFASTPGLIMRSMQERVDPQPQIDTERFVTLHDLSRDCDVRHKQIWYRLKNLIQKGSLEAGRDFYTADYVDPLHFEWKVDPVRYLALSPEHRLRFDARQRRVQAEAASTPPEEPHAPKLESEEIRKEPQRESKVEATEGQGVSERVVEALLSELSAKNQTINDLQTTIRTMSGDFRSFGEVMQHVTQQNARLQDRIFQLAAPTPEREDRSSLETPSSAPAEIHGAAA